MRLYTVVPLWRGAERQIPPVTSSDNGLFSRRVVRRCGRIEISKMYGSIYELVSILYCFPVVDCR